MLFAFGMLLQPLAEEEVILFEPCLKVVNLLYQNIILECITHIWLNCCFETVFVVILILMINKYYCFFIKSLFK